MFSKKFWSKGIFSHVHANSLINRSHVLKIYNVYLFFSFHCALMCHDLRNTRRHSIQVSIVFFFLIMHQITNTPLHLSWPSTPHLDILMIIYSLTTVTFTHIFI